MLVEISEKCSECGEALVEHIPFERYQPNHDYFSMEGNDKGFCKICWANRWVDATLSINPFDENGEYIHREELLQKTLQNIADGDILT